MLRYGLIILPVDFRARFNENEVGINEFRWQLSFDPAAETLLAESGMPAQSTAGIDVALFDCYWSVDTKSFCEFLGVPQ